jgi:2-dehydro-3-deoxygluconokinase
MGKIVCFGELMGRLNPKGFLKIVQADSFELSFAGGEANVAVSLANFGIHSSYVTKLPKNDIAKSALRVLKGYDVDVSGIAFGGERMGMYYVEKGASQRPSKVIYDRKYSSIAESSGDDFDWGKIFTNADWFHFTGITPALSPSLPDICMKACETAKNAGVRISCDLNYRKNLWSSEKACAVMSKLMKYVDVCIANEEDAEMVFGIKAENTDITNGIINKVGYESVAKQLQDKFNFKQVAITLRQSISASDNKWAGMLFESNTCHFSKEYLIHIIDRVGGGDAFAGGLIYALHSGYEPQLAIEFAAAASCLKQTIEYDFNQVSAAEVESLIKGNASGRIQR